MKSIGMPIARCNVENNTIDREEIAISSDWKLLLDYREQSRLRPICRGVNDLVTALRPITIHDTIRLYEWRGKGSRIVKATGHL